MQRVTITPDQLVLSKADGVDPDRIGLTASQIHYLQRVLRLGGGDRFIAVDGRGQGWIAALEGNGQTAVVLEPWQTHTEVPHALHLLVAMPKTGMDDIVRQTTELGVTSIQPVVSDRTLLKPSDKKVERWRRIAQEAMEQCERQQVPVIHPPVSLTAGLQQVPSGWRWICVARQDSAQSVPLLLAAVMDALSVPAMGNENQSAIALAIGPEGGWTAAEVESAIAQGYAPVSLGPRILRTVTAPIAALSMITAAIDIATHNIGTIHHHSG